MMTSGLLLQMKKALYGMVSKGLSLQDWLRIFRRRLGLELSNEINATVHVDGNMESSMPGIFMVGDANIDMSHSVPHAMWSTKRAVVYMHGDLAKDYSDARVEAESRHTKRFFGDAQKPFEATKRLFAKPTAELKSAQGLLDIDVVYVLFCITTFVLTLTEILLYAKRNLQPLTYLIFQTAKTLFWSTYFIVVTIYNQAAETSLINSSEYQLQTVDGWTRYVLAAALTLLSHIATLIYASVIYHRYRHCNTSRRPPCFFRI
ncbi:hypothetical protein HO173_000124 [Letharia columbiana]|uniref:Uncharacterized protein n=1 Tax=Letharia columbiana TaxID=112416 RepID=A0A8H6G6M1_9LECA|nr:uncharacterized protein HO173_000124 [Letharia columbiana]KAF6241414.1 hypothetical protein HO173_000124 [Letharia columbiana]